MNEKKIKHGYNLDTTLKKNIDTIHDDNIL